MQSFDRFLDAINLAQVRLQSRRTSLAHALTMVCYSVPWWREQVHLYGVSLGAYLAQVRVAFMLRAWLPQRLTDRGVGG